MTKNSIVILCGTLMLCSCFIFSNVNAMEGFESVSLPSSVDPFVSDAFLRIDGIDGSSSADRYKGWCDVEGFTLNIENCADMSGGGGGEPSPKFSGLIVSKLRDKASAELMKLCCNNRHLKQVRLVQCRAAGRYINEFYRLTLEDVRVKYISPVSAVTPGLEVVAFESSRIRWEFKNPYDLVWSVGGWDFLENTELESVDQYEADKEKGVDK